MTKVDMTNPNAFATKALSLSVFRSVHPSDAVASAVSFKLSVARSSHISLNFPFPDASRDILHFLKLSYAIRRLRFPPPSLGHSGSAALILNALSRTLAGALARTVARTLASAWMHGSAGCLVTLGGQHLFDHLHILLPKSFPHTTDNGFHT